MIGNTGIEHLHPARVQELSNSWVEHLAKGDRDPRMVIAAMNRALALPDDAGSVDRGRALTEHAAFLTSASQAAMFEVRFVEVQREQPVQVVGGHADWVTRLLQRHMAGEVKFSAEWWALRRVLLEHLNRGRAGRERAGLRLAELRRVLLKYLNRGPLPKDRDTRQ